MSGQVGMSSVQDKRRDGRRAAWRGMAVSDKEYVQWDGIASGGVDERCPRICHVGPCCSIIIAQLELLNLIDLITSQHRGLIR